MDDDPSASTDGKLLTNLRVIDLKQELEKRGLSKSGSKKDLVKRLKQQIEFEKLCEERKSTGDHDLKLELDAVTEQNEFVQQYLAQQQKIYAEQQEVKRLVELEEIQKSGDERESCETDSLGEENEEKSVSSSETEEQNKNECNEKCDTTSGESAEPSSSENVSERNSDDFIHLEVLQEESLTNTSMVTTIEEAPQMEPDKSEPSQKNPEPSKEKHKLSHEKIKPPQDKHKPSQEKLEPSQDKSEPLQENPETSQEQPEPSEVKPNSPEKPVEPILPKLTNRKLSAHSSKNATYINMVTTIEEAPQKEPEKSEHSQKKPERSQEKHKPSHEKIKPPQEKPEPSQEKPEPSQEKLETSMKKLDCKQDQPKPSQEKPNSPEKPVEPIMPKMTNRKLSILSSKKTTYINMVTTIEAPQKKPEHSQEKRKSSHDRIKPPHDKPEPSQGKPEPSQGKPEPSQGKPEPSQEKLETSMEKLERSQEQPEPSQEKPNSPEKPVEPIMPKMTNRKLSILSRKLNRNPSEEEIVLKKSRWGSYTSSLSRSSINISSDSLKKFIPDFKLITGPISTNDMDDPFNPVFPSEPSPVATEPKLPNFIIAKEVINEEAMEENSILVVSKPLPVQKEQETEQRPIKCPSPQGPVSKIVFIQNLVRPFTLLQLKELLRQTGNMVEESFWTDRIKSKCFIEYETEEEALKTREALNGARWPSSNPKILSVEFATQEELDQHKNGSEGPHAMSQRPIPTLTEVRDTRTVLALPAEDHRKKERDHRKEAIKTKPQLPIREWDKDKISQETPERERAIASGRERERGSRSVEKKDKKDSKRRTNEDTPAKLLDDLFQKTKSSPCIYWLPLTEEQVKQKEEDRRLRMLAREKKNQQKEEEAAATTTTTTTTTTNNNRRTRNRPPQKGHDKESRRSQTRSRSPVTRRR